MAGRGPRPKPAATRARRNKPAAKVPIGAVETQPLPPLPNGEPFGERVQAWYAGFLADYGEVLGESDYPELHAVAALWEAFWMTLDKGIHAEVRIKLDELRRRLDDRAGRERPKAEQAGAAPVTDIRSWRESLNA